ncbi:MAG: hypothetical protein IK085_07365 [Clostridia bacterium]|nr:hypothetical protein [Clostridia bacterium]
MKSLKALKHNNRGAGIITVIVALSFLATLGLLIMAISYTSSEMKSSERVGREVAYNATGVVEQLRSGVQLAVSDSIKSCYSEVMSNYSYYGKDIKSTFDRAFTEALNSWRPYKIDEDGVTQYFTETGESLDKTQGIPFLCGGSADHNFNTPYAFKEQKGFYVKALEKFVKAGFGGEAVITCLDEDGEVAEDGIGVAVWDILEADDEDNTTGRDIPQSITLKNIKVSYKRLLRTVNITTDMVINIPDPGFVYKEKAQASRFTDFAVIAEQGLQVGNCYARIDGPAFAGKVDFTAFTNQHMLWIANGCTFITPGDITVNGSNSNPGTVPVAPPDDDGNSAWTWPAADPSAFYLSESATLWANSININYNAVVNLRGETNVKNDLNLAKPGATATISGRYYGFGYSEDNSNESSAILAQGYSPTNPTKLDLSEVQDLTLAGYSFVRVIMDPTDSAKKVDVKMGQSMATKEDQRAYLVPVEFLNNDSVSIKTNPEVMNEARWNDLFGYYTNPEDPNSFVGGKLSAKDSSNKPIPGKYVFPKTETDKETLWLKDLDSYGIELQPVRQNFENDTNIIVYFFMKFSNRDKANQFFRDYFSSTKNKARVQAYLKDYIQLTNSSNGVTAGNIYVNNGDNYALGSSIVAPDIESAKEKDDRFKNLCITLSENVKVTDAKEEERISATTPFDYFTKHDAAGSSFIAKALNEDSDGVIWFTRVIDGDVRKVALITNKPYTYDGSEAYLCMIISTANVTITKDFKGLIMCSKNVIVQANAVLSADDNLDPEDKIDVSEAMFSEIDNGVTITVSVKNEETGLVESKEISPETPAEFLYFYGTPSVDDGEDDEGSEWDVNSLVYFDKWKKD